ncbi:hypothetical protein AAG906_012109 [Vitis piasezkii]
MADSTTCNFNLNTESIQITNQAAAEDGSTFMDPKLYEAAAHGDIHPNEKGDTPLHLAAREGHLTVVKNLIDAAKEGDAESGPAADCTVMLRMINKDNDTALHEAVRNHHPEVVKLLIQEDPDFTYGANTEGNTPLYIAAEWGFGDLVHMILDNCSSPAHDGVNGRTALHAAVILNDEAMTKKILEWKSDLTKELDQNGWSPLHFAAYVGCNPTIVMQLLEKSNEHQYVVYLGVKDDEIGNRTALHIAARRGHVDLVKVLVSHFPDCCEKVDDKGNNVLHLIMPKKIFVTSGLMNEKNAEGKTPLHLWHNSPLSKGVNYFPPPETTFTWILDTFVRSRRRSPSFELGLDPWEVRKYQSKGSEESKEISEIKKTMKSHMIVAALIAMALPGHGNLIAPNRWHLDKHGDMASAAKENFSNFVMEDSIAMVLSMCAIGIYFLASFPIENKKTVHAYVLYAAMVSPWLRWFYHEYMIGVFCLFFFVPAFPLLVTIDRDFVVPLLVTIIGIGPLGSLEVKEDTDSGDSKGSEEISKAKKEGDVGLISNTKLKKTMESHMIVAALIATVTFAAGFTLPGGYIPDKGYPGHGSLIAPYQWHQGQGPRHGNCSESKFQKFCRGR